MGTFFFFFPFSFFYPFPHSFFIKTHSNLQNKMENVWNIGDIAMKAYEGDLASEKILIEMISWGLILQAVFVALTLLLWQAAPYGRYANNAGSLWGIKVNGRLAWIIQESPCVILPFIFHYYDAPRMNDLGNRILSWAYLLHYLNPH